MESGTGWASTTGISIVAGKIASETKLSSEELDQAAATTAGTFSFLSAWQQPELQVSPAETICPADLNPQVCPAWQQLRCPSFPWQQLATAFFAEHEAQPSPACI